MDDAYLKKDNCIRKYYKEIKEASDSTKKDGGGKGLLYDRGRQEYISIYRYSPDEIMSAINFGERTGRYIELNTLIRNWNDPSTIYEDDDISKYKDLQEMLQNHYNTINARIMKSVLVYYMEQLAYWKNYLKELEELEKVQEFE